MKSKGMAELKELALQHSRWKHPTLPDKWRSTYNYTDKTANGLTRCIIDYCRFNGMLAERINCTGRAVDQTRIVEDILGDLRHIGSVKWLPTSGMKGTADISATIKGRSVKIEVKMKDKQSEAQKEYQRKVEAAFGLYWICHNFEEFLNYYKQLN